MSRWNLPSLFLDRLKYANGILVAGIGGGWDVIGGLPLVYELKELQHPPRALANYSSVSGIFARLATDKDDPEGLIAKELDIPLYLLGREGVQVVRRGYEEICAKHNVTTIIMVDGGVDSLMHGDEEGAGTVLEDSISMAAIAQLNVPTKILVCCGLGTEIEEGVCHYHALENMAQIIQEGGFLGSCSLTPDTKAFEFYSAVLTAASAKTKRKSHIHSRIAPAVQGKFGPNIAPAVNARVEPEAEDVPVIVNPLMGIYWFFDFEVVKKHNLLIDRLRLSGTFTDARTLHREMWTDPNHKKKKREVFYWM